MEYFAKHVLVLGLGESGLAMTHWLNQCGAIVRVADTRSAPERLAELHSTLPNIEFIGGAFTTDLLNNIDIVALSPGLSPHNDIADIIGAAKTNNIPVWGEIELFAQALAKLFDNRAYRPKIIAITGTNGKTTVTNLVGLLCERSGLSVRVAGNISPAALNVLQQAINTDTLPQVWVLELSSFQLHSTYSLKADAAAILNITEDHLDWHHAFDDYATAKGRIFGDNTIRVLNRDDKNSIRFANSTAPVITFGKDAATQIDTFGLCTENDVVWLSVGAGDAEAKKINRKKEVDNTATFTTRLMPIDALHIVGQHNALNALAALALCRAIDLPMSSLLHGLRQYKGEPHRLNLIATIAGVHYYDDSKGTNVGATVAALQSLGLENHHRLLLIAGGDGKGQNFAPLTQVVALYVDTIFLIGKDASTLRASLASTNVTMIDCDTLENAVFAAAKLAQAGDIVLLSPACASLDMFKNYVHRAEVFIDAVCEVALNHGEVIV